MLGSFILTNASILLAVDCLKPGRDEVEPGEFTAAMREDKSAVFELAQTKALQELSSFAKLFFQEKRLSFFI